MREILAAWACCSLVGLGALLIAERDRTAIAVYAGVHIPAAHVPARAKPVGKCAPPGSRPAPSAISSRLQRRVSGRVGLSLVGNDNARKRLTTATSPATT